MLVNTIKYINKYFINIIKPKKMRRPPEFDSETRKFLNQKVSIITSSGQHYEGVLRGISEDNNSVIIMTEKEKILVNDTILVVRKRDMFWKDKDNKSITKNKLEEESK